MPEDEKRWGVELLGPEDKKALWMKVLKPPFDPFMEVVADPRGDYHVLVSSQFDEHASAADVYELAKSLVPLLSTTMRRVHDFDALTIGAIVDLVGEGQPKKQHFLSVKAGGFRFRAFAEVTNRDAEGKTIPTQSTVQRWIQAAERSAEIASAIRYLDDDAGWFDVYKACEALDGYPNPGISKKKLRLVKRTADWHRHHRSIDSKIEPIAKPMSLGEAKQLVVRWLDAAIADVIQD